MIPKPLPIVSVDDFPPLSWREISYGLSQRLIGWKSPVNLAARNVREGSHHETEIELSGIGKDQDWKVTELVARLAEMELPESEDEIRRKWLFIVLRWVYRNKETLRDPLQEVEELYADFGYPPEISQLVRFLPPTDGYKPEMHSREANLSRLYRLWSEYLDTAEKSFT